MNFILTICTIYTLVQLMNSTLAEDDVKVGILQRSMDNRGRRSGGYPKFPVREEKPQATETESAPSVNHNVNVNCGTREISHQPHRLGLPYPKIIGGSEGMYGAYPWQVEIETYKTAAGKFEHHCGGSVVADHLVVTAAHCTFGMEPGEFRIVVGKHNLGQHDPFQQIFKVDRILIHPDFKKGGPYSNDIALIKVKSVNNKGFSFNSYVRPICLPNVLARSAAGSWCTVTGWGAQKSDDMESLSPVLRAASVPILEQETCRAKEVYGSVRHHPVLDSMICAGLLDGGVDACGGDSGGPLACEISGRFVLTGIVSWGDSCAKKGKPGVYTRVSYFTEWIQESAKKLEL